MMASAAGTVVYAETTSTATAPVSASEAVVVIPSTHPIHTLHVTCWQAGSTKYRRYLDNLFKTTVVNSVTIDIKELQGEVYIPGVIAAQEAHAYVSAMPDLAQWLADLKKRGIYTIARQVVFKDNIMPRKRPALGVHNHEGELWYDRHRVTWLDPYKM